MGKQTGIGWFGIPGGPEWRSTKTHIVIQGKLVCGVQLSKKQEFQWCSDIGVIIPECRSCRRWRKK
jgi:hypothetical protein